LEGSTGGRRQLMGWFEDLFGNDPETKKAGENVKDTYENLPPDERDKFHDQLEALGGMLGVSEETRKKLRQFADGGEKSTLSTKDAELDRLESEFAQKKAKHADNPERIKDLQYLYDIERRKIIERED
jgi:hypothetical protein